jgi:hypothetical protein
MSFADYIRAYELQRSEGLLLRHLSQVWKVLSQTVPEAYKTEPVVEMELYFRELIRAIDSSLLEEWEKMRNPDYVAAELSEDKPARPQSYDVTRDAAEFRRLVRVALLGVLQDAAARDWESAAAKLDGARAAGPIAPAELPRRMEDAFGRYFAARGRFRLDPEGRSARHTYQEMNTSGSGWLLSQVLVDPEGLNDWQMNLSLDLAASRAAARPVLAWEGLEPISPSGEETLNEGERTKDDGECAEGGA